MSQSHISFVIGLAAFAGACGATESAPPQAEKEVCEDVIEGKRFFIGSRECLSQLPKRRMSGVWVLGHEYSVFYEGSQPEIPPGSYAHVWLQADPSKVLSAHGLKFDGESRAFRVEFIGTKSDARGLYGQFGRYSRGALVVQMLSLEEIPLSRSESKH